MKGTATSLFVAGQIGWDREGRLVSDDFVDPVRPGAGERAGRGVGGRGLPRVAWPGMVLYVTDKARVPAQAQGDRRGLAHAHGQALSRPWRWWR